MKSQLLHYFKEQQNFYFLSGACSRVCVFHVVGSSYVI